MSTKDYKHSRQIESFLSIASHP
uniref:Uncharacterized protein n=1 Tax=Rhizophora mucronata TaxID=61149 RepID=A0A2P2R3I3_RHIMU